MTAPVVVPIVISSIATLAGITTAIPKKVSSCSQCKLGNYRRRYTIVSDAYTQLSSMFSEDIDDEVITAEEFSAMSALYNSAMTKLEEINNNNNDKIIDDGIINDGKNFKGFFR